MRSAAVPGPQAINAVAEEQAAKKAHVAMMHSRGLCFRFHEAR